ncbi:MerR family DNA-binding transcriptional regulator [Paenibacillus herberti]|uniref:MerR family transcriptional regulator n=1 Tax=Paenibacillus herberti TaxID=1619309 RepID=A0A229NX21_9BACL|nr:MerR family DNA-binding transcriptional regulator [Paenibacillus herberti]OXM14367.1 MerR family transcriptional regulator [Paenibacillus herberti]
MTEVPYTPKQLANKLNLSTTTLRRYEELGLIPDVPRTASNRRWYTTVHLLASAAIRILIQGYDIPVVHEAMKQVKDGNTNEALWLLNQGQYKMQLEKRRVEEIMPLVRNADFSTFGNVKLKDRMSIGEVADLAGVNTSAIRYWEQEGLIVSERNQENGYRLFTPVELRKIFVISSLRKTVYFIGNIKQLLDDLESRHFTKVERSFQIALQELDSQLHLQFQGIAVFMAYLTAVNPAGDDGETDGERQ